MSQTYTEFLDQRRHCGGDAGFAPKFMPDFLFPFQRSIVDWSCRKGRAAVFADCGLGKTAMQLAWAQNVVERTNKPVLVLTPLAVGAQTVREAGKFGIAAERSRDGKWTGGALAVVANYERLHYFEPSDFGGVVCDESSILKHESGATRKAVTRFLTKMPFRSLWTATAAPNDYTELGTSSEALGGLSYSDMLTRFFKQMDQKTTDQYEKKIATLEKHSKHFAKLSYRVSQVMSGWRLKGHAHEHFWRWVASWAKACRKPSDIGFSDSGYQLPPLIEREHIVKPATPPDGMLFNLPAFGLKEERDERRRTMSERCELAAQLVNHGDSAVVWCHMNQEGDLLEKLIPDSVQVAGKTSDDVKEEAYENFASGRVRVLITKPKIGAWGLNWQHCRHVVTFASHSYEQYYQSVRRCWRFGQDQAVNVDIISSEGELRVRESMDRKAAMADMMFTELVRHMNHAMTFSRVEKSIKPMIPNWMTA